MQIACDNIKDGTLQALISSGAHNNEVPTIFAALFIAFYELVILRHMEVHDYPKLVTALGTLQVTTLRKAIEPTVRRANINSIKGAIQDAFAENDVRDIPLGKPLVYTENSLRRSRIELPHYEFKQGVLSLGNGREFQLKAVQDIIETICGMANIEPGRDSYIYIGVADKAADAQRIFHLDGVEAFEFEGRSIVGIDREAKVLKMSLDDYVMRLKDKIASSGLSSHLLENVLSKLDCFVYHGRDILRIVVPGQEKMSFLKDQCFSRQASSTIKVPVQSIPEVARRFQ